MHDEQRPASDRTAIKRLAVTLFLSIVVLTMHWYAVLRIRSWEKGYPADITLRAMTPPDLMVRLHSFGPSLVALAFAASVVPLVRRRMGGGPRRSDLVAFWVSTVSLFGLLVLSVWATIWVVHVGRLT